MFSEKDFERLWFLYKTEGEPNGVSINSFCIGNNIPYTAFYDWFKKTQKKVVPVEVEGTPEELIAEGKQQQAIEVLDKGMEVLPPENVPLDYSALSMGELYYQLGEKEKAEAIYTGIADNAMRNVNWYFR